MTHGYALIKHHVEFIKASQESSLQVDSNNSNTKQNTKGNGLSGEDAKSFYENLLKSPSLKKSNLGTKQSKQKLTSKRTHVDVKPSKRRLEKIYSTVTPKKPCFQPNISDYFKAAEKGCLTDVQKILETRLIDIDATDQFSWTALMMASNQGHENVVRHLLIQGAEWENKVLC